MRGAHTYRIVCAARPFGVEPGSAVTVDQVTVVYAWTLCKETLPDGQYGDQVAVPVAIRLGQPPSIHVPQSGENHEGDRYAMFPANLHDIAAGPVVDLGGMQTEVDRQAGHRTSTTPSAAGS
jgi:hypothetical protein